MHLVNFKPTSTVKVMIAVINVCNVFSFVSHSAGLACDNGHRN